ncbi:MAG: protein kinase [Acidobacteria bacterium]|nr:protein kinase [Acidobacteriota bacterium]
MIGQTVSHYKIIEKLGQGGMGVVYKAQDLNLDRFVALKFLPEEMHAAADEKQRFIHEARAASALDHPHICTIHEINETEGGRLYIAMAHYEGETLNEKIGRGPLKQDEALDIARQAANGLARAHERGIVHRDIKPANLMLTADGLVKILDFGLAKLTGRTVLTRTGSTLGTAAYMSPEQARGGAVDGRSDIWSLGVVLYEILAGRRPFKGAYEQAVIYGILNEKPAPLMEVVPGTPPALAALVERCLAKDAADRPASAAELAAALAAILAGKTPTRSLPHPSVRTGRPWWRQRSALASLLVFLVAVTVRVLLLASPLISPRHLEPGSRTEIGAVAISLATTGQYADPYIIPTGPTAHPLPFPTGLRGMIYRLFGLTATAGLVWAAIAILGYATLYGLLPWFAARAGLGIPAGLAGGLLGALGVPGGTAEVAGGGNGPFPAILMLVLLAAFLRRWTGGSTARGSLLLGLVAGASFHAQPALLPVVLGCLAFGLWSDRTPRAWRHAGILAWGILMACLPWAGRNYATFGDVFFIRSNFGLELRLANHDGAAADIDVTTARERVVRHPGRDRAEALLVGTLGETEYMRRARAEAFDWIRGHPGGFLTLTVTRFLYFWAGPLHTPLAALPILLLTAAAAAGAWRGLPRLSLPQRAVLVIPLLTYPLVYYVVSYMYGYRAPLEWLVLLLAGAALTGWGRRDNPLRGPIEA